MKTFLLAATAFSTLLVATPSFGQVRDDHRYRDVSPRQRIERLLIRIDADSRRGMVSRAEAVRLRSEAWQIARLETEYSRNGLSGWERSELDRRIALLRDRLRGAEAYAYRGGGYDRGGTYDRGYDYDDGGTYGGYDGGWYDPDGSQGDGGTYDPAEPYIDDDGGTYDPGGRWDGDDQGTYDPYDGPVYDPFDPYDAGD